jgi:OOP family OmpA-OmpF porin
MKKIIFAIAAATVAMSAAQAQTISKPYIGIGATTAKHELNLGSGVTTSKADNQGAAKIFVGAEITPMFGIEAGHSRSGQDHVVTAAGVSGDAETTSRRTYLAAKATMPMNEQFSLYGKLGAVHTKDKISSPLTTANYSESDNGVYAGIGGQYNFNEKVAMTLEYERNGKKRDFGAKVDAVTIAAKYTF